MAMLVALPLLAAAGVILASTGVLRRQAQPFTYVAVCVITYHDRFDFMGISLREPDHGGGTSGISAVDGRACPTYCGLPAARLRPWCSCWTLERVVLCVVLARTVIGFGEAEVAAALLALCGHNWPIFLRFRGGRGILPGFGALSVMAPWVALAGGGIVPGYHAVQPDIVAGQHRRDVDRRGPEPCPHAAHRAQSVVHAVRVRGRRRHHLAAPGQHPGVLPTGRNAGWACRRCGTARAAESGKPRRTRSLLLLVHIVWDQADRMAWPNRDRASVEVSPRHKARS